MKRWMPVCAFLLAVAVAPAAFADHCSVCVGPTWCDHTASSGGVTCIFYQDPWCEEVGWCDHGAAAPRSFSASWKVASVRVLSPAEQLAAATPQPSPASETRPAAVAIASSNR